MKKTLLSLASVILIALSATGQTATNFNCNDCAAVNHDLFTELDAGKVIVITWVMPCGSCITGASTAANTVLGYASSNPGMVKFYLVDDYANTSCSTLSSWAATNSITTDAKFSNSAIDMTDYGTTGMPKTVVLGGGTNHLVYYNVNGNGSASAIQTAINNALVGMNETVATISSVSLFPSPVSGNQTTLNYELTSNSDVTIDIYNMLGAKVKSNAVVKQTVGKHEAVVDLTGFTNGVYFIQLGADESSKTIKFIIAN